jgi:hypothetical protein
MASWHRRHPLGAPRLGDRKRGTRRAGLLHPPHACGSPFARVSAPHSSPAPGSADASPYCGAAVLLKPAGARLIERCGESHARDDTSGLPDPLDPRPCDRQMVALQSCPAQQPSPPPLSGGPRAWSDRSAETSPVRTTRAHTQAAPGRRVSTQSVHMRLVHSTEEIINLTRLSANAIIPMSCDSI